MKKVGLPIPDFFIYGDDKEYMLRIKKHGLKILICEYTIVKPFIKREINYKEKKLKILKKEIKKATNTPWKLYYYYRNSLIVSIMYKDIPNIMKILIRGLQNTLEYAVLGEYKISSYIIKD